MGMAHLAKHKVVHRDLAACNVLLDKTRICKISDFGLARDTKTEGPLSEAVEGRAVSRSNGWLQKVSSSASTQPAPMCGLLVSLMWEVFELGASPYPDHEPGESFIDKLESGLRLYPPQQCPQSVFGLMRSCWSWDPSLRPSFKDAAKSLSDCSRE